MDRGELIEIVADFALADDFVVGVDNLLRGWAILSIYCEWRWRTVVGKIKAIWNLNL